MSKEDFLREAMTRAAGHGEPEVGDAFARFQRVRSRGNFIRGLIVSTSAIGVSLALVFTLPGLSPKTDSFAVPSLNPTLRTYVDPIIGFQFDYPSDWALEGTPGKKVVVEPQAEFSTATATNLHVTIEVVKVPPGPACTPPSCAPLTSSGSSGIRLRRSATVVDGRAAWVNETVWDANPPDPAKAATWCGACHTVRTGLDNWYDGGTGWSVTIELAYIEGRTEGDLDAARAVAASFRRYPTP